MICDDCIKSDVCKMKSDFDELITKIGEDLELTCKRFISKNSFYKNNISPINLCIPPTIQPAIREMSNENTKSNPIVVTSYGIVPTLYNK